MRLCVAGGAPFINPCLCQLTSDGHQKALPASSLSIPYLTHSYGAFGVNANIYIKTTNNEFIQILTLSCQFSGTPN